MSVIERPGYSPGRLVAAGLGILALVVAITSVSSIGPLAGAIDALVELAGYDYVVAAVLGVVAVVVGAAVFVSGRGAAMEQTEMPTVERPVPVRAAGEPFDETIGGWRFLAPVVGQSTREAVRDRLRSAAVAVVATSEGCPRPEARRRVATGAWTHDDVAAGFLAGERSTVGTWLIALTYRETGPEYRARRTVEAIIDRRNGTGGKPMTAWRDGTGSKVAKTDSRESEMYSNVEETVGSDHEPAPTRAGR